MSADIPCDSAPSTLPRSSLFPSLAARYYADAAQKWIGVVVENICIARDTFRIRLRAPLIAARIVPGQFVMLRLCNSDDPLLARPFALYDTVLDDTGEPFGLDIVYLVVGRMTRRLAAVRPGDRLVAWGPLGNRFSAAPIPRLIMVAGGIGQTPFLALGEEALGTRRYGWTPNPTSRPAPLDGASDEASDDRAIGFAQQVTLCYGVRSADYLAGVDDFEAARIEVRLSSDDGSVGRKGLVTELLSEALAEQPAPAVRVACCGPEPMMAAVARLTSAAGVSCEASLETPMACGLGICFSCVAKVRDGDEVDGEAAEWDYKRTCVEGPVFDARRIVWD